MTAITLDRGSAAVARRRTTPPLLQNAALAAAVLTFAAVATSLVLGHLRTVTMLTDSMRPGIPAGSLVVLTRRPADRISPGDVITFTAPVADRRVLTHRVVDVRRDARGLLVRTKGDANASADPWTAVISDRAVWRVRAVVPRVGGVLRAARGSALVYGAPALALGWLLATWRPRRVRRART